MSMLRPETIDGAAPYADTRSAGEQIVTERDRVYGDAVEQYRRIALVWSGILGVEVNPADAALCMIGVKMVRAQNTPDYSDNSDDVEGYLDIFRQIVGPDMIHARSVDDYVAQKLGVRL